MIQFVIINTNGDIETKRMSSFDETTFFKKCGFSKKGDFERQHSWVINDIMYSVYAKSSGASRFVNKYELPPPIDTPLFYGKIGIVATDIETEQVISLDSQEWEKVYEKLFGGFEDLDNTDGESEEDETLHMDPSQLTKTGGYVKDGFVVDDEEEIEMDEVSNTSSESFRSGETSDIDDENYDSQLEEEEYDYE